MKLSDLLDQDAEPEIPRCSRKGCRNHAHIRLLWNNPKIHTPERRKEWLACPEHEQWLRSYLEERGLYRESKTLEG